MIIAEQDKNVKLDEEIPKCPTHNLSVSGDNYLCIACELELNGTPPEYYERISDPKATGVPQVLDEKTGEMKPAYIVGSDKFYMMNKRKQEKEAKAIKAAKAAKRAAGRKSRAKKKEVVDD